MLSGLKHLLDRFDTAEPGYPDDARVAAAALLVEAACLDGNFSAAERTSITEALQRGFGLRREEALMLIAEGEKQGTESNQIYAFTRVLKDKMDEHERVRVIEMLWEVAYADGEVHEYEANLVRRVAGLLYVQDRDSGLARQRVTARLGIA